MKYNIKKDANPLLTIEKIKEILAKININCVDYCSGKGENFYSTRVEINNTRCGTNGKGTCKTNALASGYAEFIERIQGHILIFFRDIKNYLLPDEKLCDIDEIKDNIIVKKLRKNKINIKDYNNAFNFVANEKLPKNKVFLSPFISYKKRNIEYIPSIILNSQGSNGLAAGNTYEEALVQALSEIVERHCIKSLVLNGVKIPIIPKEVYQQYEGIVDLITEIESLGYKITIKDASLNENFPAICVLFEDLKYPKNGIALSFGAHPYFPIALERCLTEFMQGYYFLNTMRDKYKFFVQPNKAKKFKIIEEIYTRSTFFKKNNKHIQNILSDEADYKFNKKAWFFDEKITNKQMFHYLVKLILKHTDDIYIRNCSFLDFPTVQVYANDFSCYKMSYEYFFENYINYTKIATLKINEIDLEKLIKICEYAYLQNHDLTKIQNPIGIMEPEYVAFYSAVCLKNKKNIKKYLNIIIRNHLFINDDNNKILRLYQGFNRYFELNWKNISQDKIKEKIEKQYGNAIYNEIIRTIETISERQIFNSLKLKLEDKNFEEEYLKDIKQKLCKIYCDNLPDQNKIIKIIKKQNIFQHIMKRFCLKHQFDI